MGLADQAVVAPIVTASAGASGALRRLAGQYSLAGQRAFGMGAGLLTDYDNTFSLSMSVGRKRR